jgi:hypothetical protein
METTTLVAGHGIRAFAFSNLGIGSRLILNEPALLFLEIKLAIARAVVALIEATLSQSQERCSLQNERNRRSPRQSLTYLRLGWALPGQPAGFEQTVRRPGPSSRDFFLLS